MLNLTLLSLLAGICLTTARSPQHVGMGMGMPKRAPPPPRRDFAAEFQHKSYHAKRDSPYLNEKTAKFAVNGTGIPDVDFDIGESYAGLLPISSRANETRELYFWFFPSQNPLASDEITIWLNGGPGCSSLEGLLQENGPFIWQYGTYKPVPNPYTWVNLTNMVWVEQPIGTGFSQGKPDITDEEGVSREFLGFFKNFVETFGLQGNKVFITGESYAGQYIPYIADAMFNANDTTHFNLDSIMMYDPSTSSDAVQQQIPALAFANYWSNLLSINSSYMAELNDKAVSCGFTSFMDDYLVYPPKGLLPSPPSARYGGKCDLWSAVIDAATAINPCFDVYQVATTCPVLWDVLGFPGSFPYLPDGATIYFNRSDVQAAINAPPTNWEECSDNVFLGPNGGDDKSPPTGLSVLPSVIERTKKTIIGHGELDMILILNGTLLMIQNMTWNGAQGFQSAPSDDFFVPYHVDYSESTLAGAGVFGTTHTERGLTFVSVKLSGHMIPQYAPSAAYRQMEFLLGRIDSLTQEGDFTTQSGNFTKRWNEAMA